MKVFISWSKNSREVGKAMSDAVKEIFEPVVETFISQEIKAGARGLDEIDTALNETDFGIICLTKSNQDEQWINYEAGALSRQVGGKRERLGVFLIDFDEMQDVSSPLNIFQCKFATPEGFYELLDSINDHEPKLSPATLRKRVDSAWGSVEAAVTTLRAVDETSEAKPVRSVDDKVDELLQLVRSIDQGFGASVADSNRELLPRYIQDASRYGLKFSNELRHHLREEESQRLVVSELMEDVEMLGDWGDFGFTYGKGWVEFSSEVQLTKEVKGLVIKRIKTHFPTMDIKFSLKVRPENPL